MGFISIDNIPNDTDTGPMNHKCDIKDDKDSQKYYRLGVPFMGTEATRFRAYLKRTDKKAGAFARTAILAAIAKECAE